MQTSPFPNVILVDQDDQPIGIEEKMKAHQKGLLHRAFSVCLYRPVSSSPNDHALKNFEILLQKRHIDKYHSGGLWTNTCCSHPQPGEDIQKEAEKSLQFEMGITATLKEIAVFHYSAPLEKGLIENEIDHIFVGQFQEQNFSPNYQEIEDYKWIDIYTVQQALKETPEHFTVWFPDVFAAFCKYVETKN